MVSDRSVVTRWLWGRGKGRQPTAAASTQRRNTANKGIPCATESGLDPDLDALGLTARGNVDGGYRHATVVGHDC